MFYSQTFFTTIESVNGFFFRLKKSPGYLLHYLTAAVLHICLAIKPVPEFLHGHLFNINILIPSRRSLNSLPTQIILWFYGSIKLDFFPEKLKIPKQNPFLFALSEVQTFTAKPVHSVLPLFTSLKDHDLLEGIYWSPAVQGALWQQTLNSMWKNISSTLDIPSF